MKIALLWHDSIKLPSHITMARGVLCGTHPLHLAADIDALSYPSCGDAVRDYDVLLVNLFVDQKLITELRDRTRAKLVVIPDGSPERYLAYSDHRWLREMQRADAIATPERSSCALYGAMTGKPALLIPTAIGADRVFEEARQQPKEDFLFGSVHWHGNEGTLAALVQLQRITGMRVVFCGGEDRLAPLVKDMGGNFEFIGEVETMEYARLAARATLAIDLYNAHTLGRTELTISYAGTPVIGSTTTEADIPLKVDPLSAQDAVGMALRLLENEGLYSSIREEGIRAVHQMHSFAAVKERFADFTQQLEKVLYAASESRI